MLPRYGLFQRYTGSSIREFNMADVEPIAIWIKHLIRSFQDSGQELEERVTGTLVIGAAADRLSSLPCTTGQTRRQSNFKCRRRQTDIVGRSSFETNILMPAMYMLQLLAALQTCSQSK